MSLQHATIHQFVTGVTGGKMATKKVKIVYDNNGNPYVTITRAAELAKLSRQQVRNLIDNGTFNAMEVEDDGKTFVLRSDADKYKKKTYK